MSAIVIHVLVGASIMRLRLGLSVFLFKRGNRCPKSCAVMWPILALSTHLENNFAAVKHRL